MDLPGEDKLRDLRAAVVEVVIGEELIVSSDPVYRNP
jgi:hypothetical protein